MSARILRSALLRHLLISFNPFEQNNCWTGEGNPDGEAYRDVGGHDGLGDRHYARYCGAFDWVEHCVDAGYSLEAIAVLDSIIWDRLSSRLGYLSGERVNDRNTLGRLCKQVVGTSGKGGLERVASFQDAELQMQEWVNKRNDAVHATAKVFRDETSDQGFRSILRSHKETAEEGIRHLQAFDLLDTESRQKAEKIPASWPDAFFRTGGLETRS